MPAGFMARIVKNIQAMLRALADNGIYVWPNNGTPVDGTTGANVIDYGGFILDTSTGTLFQNNGTLASPVWVAITGGQVGVIKRTLITSAQVKALRATPITVAPAPGAGFILEFLGGSVALVYGGSNAFTNPQNLAIKHKDGTGGKLSNDITAAGLIDQAASELTETIAIANTQETKAASDNQPLVIHNIGASEITGNAANDNVLQVKVEYRITAVGW